MEAILMDVKRGMRSLRGIMHAVSGALRHGVDSGVRKAGQYRSIGNAHMMRDVYGRDGRVDIYSGKEMVEFHRAMHFGKQPPL
jgi:hypothetical protein